MDINTGMHINKIKGNILITGGTGTLGRAIIRRAHTDNWPCSLTVFSRDPVKQLNLQREYPDVRCVLGDIRDYDVLSKVVVGHDIIIHAAANKHIPHSELNVQHTIDVNVQGSLRVAEAAVRYGVSKVVGISTDKVCYPINVYGNTKALMERSFQEYNRLRFTEFHVCRYGNVFGSAGSVVELWLNQVESGTVPTITVPSMTRFWLSEDDAVDIVVNALEAPSGSILVPLAPACSMEELLFYSLGVSVYREIGARPGEKHDETLITSEEAQRTVPSASQAYALITDETQEEHDIWPAVIGGYHSSDPVHVLSADEIQDMAAAL